MSEYIAQPHNYLQFKPQDGPSVDAVLGAVWKHLGQVLRTRMSKLRPDERSVRGPQQRELDQWGSMKASTRTARMRRGIDPGWMSQAQVARLKGLSRKTLARWEKDYPDEIQPVRRDRRTWYRPSDVAAVDRIINRSPRLARRFKKSHS